MSDLVRVLRGQRIDGRGTDEIMRLAADEIESLRSRLQKVMARCADLLDEDQFNELDAIASSASGVQYKPCEICTTQSWCKTHGCQCYPVSAVQPERCCLDYPRCDCNSPPEPDNLPCGHPASLLIRSAETGEPLYCKLCDNKRGRRDAERCETELRAEVERLKAALKTVGDDYPGSSYQQWATRPLSHPDGEALIAENERLQHELFAWRNTATLAQNEEKSLRYELAEARSRRTCGGDQPYMCHDLATARSELAEARGLLREASEEWIDPHAYDRVLPEFADKCRAFMARIDAFLTADVSHSSQNGAGLSRTVDAEQSPLDRMADNARELGLDYTPADQPDEAREVRPEIQEAFDKALGSPNTALKALTIESPTVLPCADCGEPTDVWHDGTHLCWKCRA